jgi:hypothetical protein
MAKLAENGVENDAAAVRVVSEQAPRVAGRINHPQDISNTLWAIASASFAISQNIEGCSRSAMCKHGKQKPFCTEGRGGSAEWFLFPVFAHCRSPHSSMFRQIAKLAEAIAHSVFDIS